MGSIHLDRGGSSRSIILWGMLGSLPFGGMVWQVFHYLIALRRLGFDVWYVEDSDRPVYDPFTQNPTYDFSANVALLADYMQRIGMSDRWVFRPPGVQGKVLGSTDYDGLLKLYGNVEAAINLCGAQEPLEGHQRIRCRVYLETDPVENQVAVAKGHQGVIDRLSAHDFHFTYGENLGAKDCPVPMGRFDWRPTRPPVCLDLWGDQQRAPGPALTTIAKWSHHSTDVAWKGYDSKDVVWGGHVWRWSKRDEFLKFIDIPSDSRLPLEIAIGSTGSDIETLQRSGWLTRPAATLNDPDVYREYIQSSRGEFTVSKDQYVSSRSGWFSDRSVCYLAAGRPVVTQDTGFSKFIPTGCGLFAYSGRAEALAAMQSIDEDYDKNSLAAIEVAHEYFDAEKVVGKMLSSIGLV